MILLHYKSNLQVKNTHKWYAPAEFLSVVSIVIFSGKKAQVQYFTIGKDLS